VHGVHDGRQMDIHTAEPLVPEPSLIEVEIVGTGNLKLFTSYFVSVILFSCQVIIWRVNSKG